MIRITKDLKMFCFIYSLIIVFWVISLTECTPVNKSENVVNHSYKKICNTEACKNLADEIRNKVNINVEPCDDFYEYVCGSSFKNAEIPDDQLGIGSFEYLTNKLQKDLKIIIENDITENDTFEYRKKLKSFYDTCMNEKLVNDNSEKEFLEVMSKLGDWPVLIGDSWNESNFDLQDTIQRFDDTWFFNNFIISVTISPDEKNSNSRMINIDQALDRSGISKIYFKQGPDQEIVKAYFECMVDLVETFKVNRTIAKQHMKESLDFEIKLAKISLSSSQRRDPLSLYNPMTVEDLQSNYSFINWEKYLNSILFPYAKVNSSEVVNVKVPSYFSSLANLTNNTSKRALANYFFSRALDTAVPYLNDNVHEAQRKFHASAYGSIDKVPRWLKCVYPVSKKMHLAIGSLYVKKHFDKKSKNIILDIVSEVKKSFHQILEKVDWMSNETKQRALEKLDKISSLVGYPDELLNDTILNDFYKNLTIDTTSYLKTILDHRQFWKKNYVENLRKPILRDYWTTFSAAVVNAFYQQQRNNIAGILQGAFFNSERPNYMNYGGIGTIIGHEIIHGFDDRGRNYNKNGDLFEWWDLETTEKHKYKTECIVKQYNNYTVQELNSPVNGKLNLAENIADNGGLKEAYHAYENWQKKNGDEPTLPGFESFTSKQMFWISFAHLWCSKYEVKNLKNVIMTDPHAPHKFRVIGSITNMPEFSVDFNCSLGSRMNPRKKCNFR